MLFDEIVFGPIHSRRLGNSLGINLLPTKKKYCNYNCIYCECGWNEKDASFKQALPSRKEVLTALEKRLIDLKEIETNIDSITFSGNGEPSIHPEFAGIIDDVIACRDKFFPNAIVTVLSNATRLYRQDIFNALQKIENPILKLDSGTEEMYKRINKPNFEVYNFSSLLENLIRFGNKATIQTLLLRGICNGEIIDNTTDKEFSAYLEHLKAIKPHLVMLYAIDRETPEKNLEKLSLSELEIYAEKIRATGIPTKTFS